MPSVGRFLIRNMCTSDLEAIVALHLRAFPDYFLSHLGATFLHHFYSEFVEQRHSYGFVALNEEQIVGLVMGVADSAAHYRRFYRRHAINLIPIVVSRLVTDNYVRKNFRSRLPHLSILFRSFLQSRQASSTYSARAEGIPARLLSIAVDSDYRGQGIADELVRYLCDAMHRNGIERVGLSVLKNNSRAVAFYEKTGWQREKTTPQGIYYWRWTQASDKE